MNRKRILSILKRLTMIVFGLGTLIGIIAFLPGDIEGQYLGIGIHCGCDSFNFMRFRDSKILNYMSNHPPANIIGHYTKNPDGSINMYLDSYMPSKPDEFIGQAHPHFLITRFSWSSHGGWGIKFPKIFTIGKTIAEHEIVSTYINADRSVKKTFYDDSLKPVRSELIPPKMKKASALPVDGTSH